jgi:oligopeptide transport system substrate-binding protein
MNVRSNYVQGGVVLTVAMTLILSAALPTSAHPVSRPAQQSLPVLKLDYFAGANGQLAKTLDPALVTSATAADTIAMVNANLVHILPNNEVAPDLASHWAVSKNRKVYTFTIRPNARYSNGHYVAAADVKYAIERALAPATASSVAMTYLGAIVGTKDYSAGRASSVSGVKILGKRVLQITLVKPYAYFLKTLTYPTADALDPEVMRGKIAAPTGNFLTSNCPGNQGAGPFKFKCFGDAFYPSGQTPSYSMVPNKYYYGRKPHIQVVLPAISTIDVGYKTYLEGSIDATAIPTAFISKWEGKSNEFIKYNTSIVAYYTPNQHTAPFDDRHCRLAVAYGIDRDTIVKKILHGAPRAIYTIVPPGFLGYYSGKDNPHFNLKKAKAEFSKCGARNTPVKLTYATGSSDADNQHIAIADMLKRVGFNASTKPISLNDWYGVVSQPLDRTETQLVRNGWQQDYPDPQDYVSLLLRSDQDYNIGGFHNATFDRLVDRADIEANSKQRAQLYIKAQHLAISDGAWITMTNAVGRHLIKPHVHGLVGTVAYGDLVPKNYDWSLVSVDRR